VDTTDIQPPLRTMTSVQHRWRLGFLLGLCVVITGAAQLYFSWHLFTAKQRPLVRGVDNNYYFFWLPSVLIDHDLDFSNQVQDSHSLDEEDKKTFFAEPLSPVGLNYNKFPLGWALTSAPWFLAAQGLDAIWGKGGNTGWEPVYQIALWLGQLVYAGLGLWYAFCVLRHYFAPTVAAYAVLIGWLASPLLYYQTVGLSMVHSVVFSLVAYGSWLGIKIAQGNGARRSFFYLGAVAGLLLVTRYTTVFYLFFPLVCLVRFFRSDAVVARKGDCAVLLVCGALPPILLQMGAWKIMFGSWLVYSYGGEGFYWLRPSLIRVLFSPLHGLFYWHPLLLVGMAGLVGWAYVERQVRPWCFSFLAMWLVNGAWWCWWFAHSFGNRSFEGAVLFAMGGLAWLLAKADARAWLKGLLVGCCALAVIWNVLLLALFLTKRISGEQAVTWAQMWRVAFHWFV